ncbi:MAG: His/Gly/Thr/Pro-type tRNA ligase C-terminal domain-containing protein, partial [Commensalibacter sp.]|nr:His/Gly/Thr/Pro-type tRNA ligase C-terminal domain-containing protein [Commensalibacter sp.]
ALANLFKQITQFYAATDEKHDKSRWDQIPQARRREGRGIEVGQIFYFGTKYTQSMDIAVIGSDGNKIYPHMGSYGIGVSRLVGAIIESSHDENGIIWPDSIAPFKACIINLGVKDEACVSICEKLHQIDPENFLYDDRDERAGSKFADADLMGHPWQIIVGPRSASKNKVEVKRRKTGERIELDVEEVANYISNYNDR